jgi:hypothetical protein
MGRLACLGELGLLACLALGVGQGCMPSHRMVHQGNAFFEHCYGADNNSEVSDADRESCWGAWLAHYTREQAGERVDYAMRRVEALQMGGNLGFETPESYPAEDPVTSKNSLQAFATSDPDRVIPHGCSATCQQLRARCQGPCPDDSDPCIESCKADERTCLGGCY